jgi:alkanesulfonate monooxygenase SsuD/methylene tetrahydromethanopterin reductase-like flavin-dependent oxidoreductase (luciferase family)
MTDTGRFAHIADHTKKREDGVVFSSPNALKLGVFAANLSGGATAITNYVGPPTMSDFDEPRRIAMAADAAGLEAMVPISRWKGFGGQSQFWDRSFETFTWGAAIAEVTERIQIVTTCAIPLVHPVMAAKLGATLDHISGGRWGLNVVPGWMGREFKMFGVDLGEHDARYRHAREWMTIVDRLWTDPEEFDFHGEFFDLEGAISLPKPVQSPRPMIMNAGQSAEGSAFAIDHADMIYINLSDSASMQGKITEIKDRAAALGKKVSVWGAAHVLCRPSVKEAEELIRHYIDDLGDYEAAQNYAQAIMGSDAQSIDTYKKDPEILKRLIATAGHFPIVGTPEMVVEELQRFSDAGVDGIALSWLNYEEGIAQYLDELLPLLRKAGLRA